MPHHLGAQTMDILATCLMLAMLTLIVLAVVSAASGIGAGMRRASPPSPQTPGDNHARRAIEETETSSGVDRTDPANWWKPDDWSPDPQD